MSKPNRAVTVARRPDGVPVPDDFAVSAIDEPQGDGVLCHVCVLSLDPYLRGRLSGRHISGPLNIGDPMTSECVLQVAEDHGPFKAGDLVRGFAPWQERAILPAETLTPLPAEIDPPSLALGVLGMPGLTAYAGVQRLLEPKPGDTLFVSAAAGPVGATVAQLCRAAGARTVGIASSADKCGWMTEQAGFDVAINYRERDLREALDEACPDGIDLYFDNVGGDVLQAAMERLAVGARVALCGLMEQYNTDSPPPGPNPALTIKARATVRGLVVYDHEDLRADMQTTLWQMIQDGTLAYREDATDGLENAPEAFCRLMAGRNFGKTIVRT
jgi:NADPH-dependent curcumin reductase CurA